VTQEKRVSLDKWPNQSLQTARKSEQAQILIQPPADPSLLFLLGSSVEDVEILQRRAEKRDLRPLREPALQLFREAAAEQQQPRHPKYTSELDSVWKERTLRYGGKRDLKLPPVHRLQEYREVVAGQPLPKRPLRQMSMALASEASPVAAPRRAQGRYQQEAG